MCIACRSQNGIYNKYYLENICHTEFDVVLIIYVVELSARITLRHYQKNYRMTMVVVNSFEALSMVCMVAVCLSDHFGSYTQAEYVIATSILRAFRSCALLHNNRLAQVGLPDAVRRYRKRRGKAYVNMI